MNKLIGELELNRIYQRDCLSDGGMALLPDKSVDMILCDLPYGTTAAKWDSVIPFDPLWEQYERVIKDNGAIVLTAAQPFTTKLIESNVKLFKYCWYWVKSKPIGFQHAKNRPMMKVEDICVFSKSPMGHASLLGDKRMVYNPQGVTSVGKKVVSEVWHGNMMGARPNQVGKEYEAFTGYPHNVLEYPSITGKKSVHPTQKPAELFEYLIRTYTNENEIILDNCMGSGTTAIATLRVGGGRKFIGFEREPEYIEIANKRLNNELEAKQ